MNVLNTMVGGVVSPEERQKRTIYLREARRKGHKFIRVRLNEENFPNPGQLEIKFNGVKTIRVYDIGIGRNRQTQYDVQVKGGELLFQYIETDDPITDGMYANLLDDQEEGHYGKKGYNRDFLASHWASGWFEIENKTVERDVRERAKKIATIVAEKEEKRRVDRRRSLEDLKHKEKQIKQEIAIAQKLNKGLGILGEEDGDNKTDS